jgi:hypothetical protein
LAHQATIHVLEDIPREFSREAARYAVRQLARRAGVSTELFRSWRIDSSDFGFVTVHVSPGTNKRICFPKADQQFWKSIRQGEIRISVAEWMIDSPAWRHLVPDFRIPFSTSTRPAIGPLFAATGQDRIECRIDLLASLFLTLSRFEETLPGPRDEHGRFPSTLSVAARGGFLKRPVVDEYGIAFEQALSLLLPGWQPEPRRLRVKLGHDVDQIGLPFSLRSAIGHALRRKSVTSMARDLLAPLAGLDTAYQSALRRLVALSFEHSLDSAVYWKMSTRGCFDAGYDVREPKLLKLIRQFQENGIEMGVHPGYRSFDSIETLRDEVSALQELFDDPRLGGRQDFLRWSPRMWGRWESLGLAYDASVGFADHIGFRAGTCLPFRAWLLDKHREAELIEIPLLAMDGTLFGYMRLEPAAALTCLRELGALCKAFGGVFSLLWHHTTQFSRGWAAMYRTLLDELSGAERFDWRAVTDGLT